MPQHSCVSRANQSALIRSSCDLTSEVVKSAGKQNANKLQVFLVLIKVSFDTLGCVLSLCVCPVVEMLGFSYTPADKRWRNEVCFPDYLHTKRCRISKNRELISKAPERCIMAIINVLHCLHGSEILQSDVAINVQILLTYIRTLSKVSI